MTRPRAPSPPVIVQALLWIACPATASIACQKHLRKMTACVAFSIAASCQKWDCPKSGTLSAGWIHSQKLTCTGINAMKICTHPFQTTGKCLMQGNIYNGLGNFVLDALWS